MITKNLWNEESIYLMLSEYKKQKDSLGILRSSHMPKKGWESIQRVLHASGYIDIRLQHVIKKFSSLKLHYKEYREGLPVKQRVYGFVDLLSDILDDDPYIAFAKPTKRMKEKVMFEKKYLKALSQSESYIKVDYIENDEASIVEIKNVGNDSADEIIVDSSELLIDSDVAGVSRTKSGGHQFRDLKNKEKFKQDLDKPNMPSWISYLVQLLKKEEQQRSGQLWNLHNSFCKAEKAKVDLLDRLVQALTNTSSNEIVVHQADDSSTTELVVENSSVVPDNKTNVPRNIIVVDEEGSIYLKPTHFLKRKGDQVEYAVAHKIMKSDSEVQFQNIEGESVIEGESFIETPHQLQFQLINGEEIIIENCDESELYKVESVYEDVETEMEDGHVISHVEIIEESDDTANEHQIDTIELIEPITEEV